MFYVLSDDISRAEDILSKINTRQNLSIIHPSRDTSPGKATEKDIFLRNYTFSCFV